MNVIFDMDGVIFDTERLCLRVWQEAAPAFALPQDKIEQVFHACVGTTQTKTTQILRDAFGDAVDYDALHRHTSARFHEIVEQEGMPEKPGAAELLRWLRSVGARIGLASSTRLAVVEQELRGAGLYDLFDAVVGGDQLRRSKPAPDIYLLACERLGVAPEETYAIEDSYNGIRAAASAGMRPIMVPDMLPATDEMRRLSAAILPDLHAVRRFLEVRL